jgi:hypothetical protein
MRRADVCFWHKADIPAGGAWWIDGVGSLAIVYFLVKEGREAWSGDDCESCCA